MQAGEQARQGRFAAAVATDQEHQLATVQLQVDGADIETGLVALARITVFDTSQLQALPLAETLDRRDLGGFRRQFQGFQLVQ